MSPKHLIATLLVVLTASACGAATPAGDVGRLTGVTWEATEVGGKPVATPAPVTLAIADGQASGRSGCNRYSATVTLAPDRISFGPLMSTKMACAEEGAMQTEAAFLDALSGAETWSISAAGQLTLSGSKGSVLFKPADTGEGR
ncbi:MAG: META domain-containing protein [Alphaproteobacteria bacterium]|nr:META domain-containing protein [Alphaproteobacteria bacterium]